MDNGNCKKDRPLMILQKMQAAIVIVVVSENGDDCFLLGLSILIKGTRLAREFACFSR